MTFQTFGKFNLVNEEEQYYGINAITQKYGVSKIINDKLKISAHFLLDHSNKTLTDSVSSKTKKVYNNISMIMNYALGNSNFKLYSGYTLSDKKLSSYGLNWKYIYRYHSLEMTFALLGGYDYYYYWNEVGEHSIRSEFAIKYNKLKLALNLKRGVVDSLSIFDIQNNELRVDLNYNKGYSGSLSYEILSKPKIKVSANYSFLDYKYKSRLYYAPSGRSLYGLSTSIYYPINHFYFYGSFGYNIGSEYYYNTSGDDFEQVYIDVDNWSAAVELGYELNRISFSLGASRFYNPYYANINALLTTRIYF
jgi:hypothetical protein